MEFREFYEQVPPKLMDCKAWHEKQENMKGDLIHLAEKKIIELKDNSSDSVLRKMLGVFKKWKYCKNDCLYCLSKTDQYMGNEPFKKTCLGPDDMEFNKHYPRDSCKKYTLQDEIDQFDDLGLLKSRKSEKDSDAVGEVCTCSTDGCNEASKQFFTNYVFIFASFVTNKYLN